MRTNRLPACALLFSLLCASPGMAAGEQAVARKTIAIWEPLGAVFGSLGYRNNVLRSGVSSENSLFLQVSGDASLMRYSETGSYLLFYILGDDIRYADAPSVNYEQFLSAAAELMVPVTVLDELGLKLDYLYQRQVIDASETEIDERRVLVLGHRAAVRPYWEHRFSERWSARIEGSIEHQLFEHTLDDYWETERMFYLMYGYGHRSEIKLGIETLLRFYETREQYDENGQPVEDTDLTYTQHELAAGWKHYFDAARHWRSSTGLSGMVSTDNGAGYFDYDRLLFREQVRWDNGSWYLGGTVRFGWYRYPLQKIGSDSRTRFYSLLDARIERMLTDHLSLFAAAEHEWSESNDPLDDYRSWMVTGGVGLEY